ncbi:MAG: tetratricopeptide repeat protein, partial [Persicimonas sp.]
LGLWENLIEYLDEALVDTADFEAIVALHLRVARIYEEELQRADAAIERFNQVLENDPENEEAILALDRLYQREGHWEELAEILQTRIFGTEDPEETRQLRLRLATLYQEALDEPQEAIEVYQTVLMEDEENQQAIDSLERMFMDGKAVQQIADILEPHYLERDQHDKLVEIYLQRLELLDDPIERYDLLMQVGRIYLNELEDEERALQAYGAALTEKPDDEEAYGRLEELADSTGQWGEAAGYYVDALESDEIHPDEALTLWLSLGRILDEELGQIADAEQAYISALEIDEGAPQALEALDRIYRDQQRFEELAEVLERRIEGLYDEEEIVELSYRLAQLFQDQLDEPASAVETYRKILELRPDHGDSLLQLERIHLEHQQWEELFDVLRRRADNTNEPDEKSELLKRMANLAEEMLERPVDAIDLWNEVLELTPDDRDALGELQRLYLEEERWNDLVEVLEHEVSLTEDPAERLALYESLGTIWQEHLDNELQALEAWQDVLSIDESHLGALEALHTIFERQGDYTELAEVVTRLIEHESVGEERTLELWTELAQIYGEMLMQPREAIECWKAVVSLDPGNDRALEELEQLYLQESMWEEAAGILELKAERTEDEQERIELLRRIADIWETKLMEADRAIEYYEQILEIDPGQMEASRSLESVYRNQGTEEAWQNLVEVYLGRAEVVADDPFERAETLRQAAQVFEEHLGQPESALLVQLSAFSPETLDDDQLHSDLERLAEQTGLWDELIERAADVASELSDGIEAADLHHKIGRWYADKIDQPDDAVYHLRRALGIEPDNPEILEKLQELYRDLASWPELATVIEQRIELTSDPDEQIELWRRLGDLYQGQMGEFDQAIDAYRRILDIDQSDLEALESLEHIFDAHERHEELIEVLEQKAEATYEPEDIVEIKERIAQIYDRDLDDAQRAIETYKEVLNVDQTHGDALQALEALYLKTQQWDELLDVYERQLNQSHEPEDQVAVYGKMAAVYEDHFEDPESAVEAYNNLLMVDPAHEGAIDSLERLYRNLERWHELVEILQRHVELLDDGARKVGLLNELGRAQRDQLEDPHAAVDSLSASVEIDDTQADILLELADLQEEIGDAQAAVDSYSRLVELIDDEEDRAELYAQMGELLEVELGDDDAAEEAYLSTLDLVPGHREAVEALRRIYERKGTWQPLIRALKKAEDASRDLDKKAEYLAEIGQIYEEKVEDRVNALSYYEEALENNARNVEAAEPLIGMYMNEQRWEKAVPLLELVIEELEDIDADPQRLHALHLQAGKTFARLEQQEDALEHYRAAYEYDSSDFETQKGLGHLLYDHEYFEKAASVFENLEFQHIDRLDQDELVELYYRSGKIQQRFGETRRAIEYFIKAVEAEPHHRPSLEELIDLYEEQNNFEQVVDYSRQLLETREEPAARFALLTRMGDLLVEKVGDRQRAVNVYLEALDIEPESMSVLRKLLDLYTNTKQWSEAVEILQQLIELETDEDRAATYNYTVGVIYRNEIGDPMEAIDYFDAALDHDVKKLKAFEAIDRILTEAKEWKELERAYRRMLRRIAENDDGSMEKIKVTLWKNIGEIYRSRLGHVQSAINSYETAAGLDPDDEQVRLILAELYEKKADDPEGAIEQHKELIRLDPFRIESYRALFKAYIKDKAYDRAWCMSAALSFLQSANEQEEKFYKQYLGDNLPAAKGQFKQDLYRLLYHDDQEMIISFIMSIIGQGLRDYYARRLKKVWDVHPRKDQLDMDQELLFCKLYKYAAQTVGVVPAPNVYLKRDQALGIRNANADPPAVIIGADMMQGKGDRELAFWLGKQLCWMRPEHYLGSVGFPTENLKLLFMAAMHITDPSLGVAEQLGEQGAEVINEMQSMPAQMLNQMRKYMKQYLSTGKNPNLSAWLTQVEHTCVRMGLVLCGDLHEAASCIKNDPNPIGKATVKEKIREMVLFSISDEYFEIRDSLGLAIDK